MLEEPKTLQSGKIWENRGTREVLWSLIKLKITDNVNIRIAQTSPGIEGEIAVARGTYIVGARIFESDKIRDYDCVRALLAVEEGTFSFVDPGPEFSTLDRGLRIKLSQIVTLLPDLPESYDDLIGKSTLNKIRALDAQDMDQVENVASGSTPKPANARKTLNNQKPQIPAETANGAPGENSNNGSKTAEAGKKDSFEQRSMSVRALAFWLAFLVFSGIAGFMWWSQHR